MESRKKIKKVLARAFLVGTLLVFLTGCASMKNLFSWLPIWSTGDEVKAPSSTEIGKALQGVRPYEDPTHYYRKGCYFQQIKKHRLAVQEFKRVVLINPSHVEAYNGMGVSYDLMGDFSNAVASYREALKINPELDYILNNLGYSYLLQGDLASAVETFKKAVELHPTSPLYRNNLGLAYAKQGLHDMALAEFERTGGATAARANLAKILNEKGTTQKEEGPVEEAFPPLKTLAKTKEAPKPERLETFSEINFPHSSIYQEMPSTVEVEEERLFQQQHIVTQPVIYPEPVCEQTPEEIEIIDISGIYGENDLQGIEDPPQPLFAGSISGPDIEIIAASAESPVPEIISVSSTDTDTDSEISHDKAETPPVNEDPAQEICGESTEIASVALPAGKAKTVTSAPKTTGDSQPTATVLNGNDTALCDMTARWIPDDSRTHEGITVEVLSFAEISALAQRVGNDLISKGLKVESIDNATSAKSNGTIIHYCIGYLQDAYTVAKAIPGYQNMKKFNKFSDPYTKVRVILGCDLLPSNIALSETQKRDPKS